MKFDDVGKGGSLGGGWVGWVGGTYIPMKLNMGEGSALGEKAVLEVGGCVL